MNPVNTQAPSLSKPVVHKKKKHRKRCEEKTCKKALSILDLTSKCICEKVYCSKHKLPENHNCSGLEKLKRLKTKQLEKDLGIPLSKKEKFNLDI